MADNSAIEWTDATWNPVTGCVEVSPGCDNCYAKTFAERWRGTPGHHFEKGFDLVLRPERLAEPLKWKKPRKVFVNSMSDLFHKDVPDSFIHQVFAVMAATPQHTYQLLTKRHGRMRSMLRDECRCPAKHQPGVHIKSQIDWVSTPHSETYVPGLQPGLYHRFNWPLPNVWVGVSVEDQERADLRIPALRDTPAAVRWLSMEPLLGPVDLAKHLAPAEPYPALSGHAWDRGNLDWVVVGGESGHGARPMHPNWARSLRDQCTSADVPYFFKQWGNWAHGAQGNLDYRRHIGFLADGQRFEDPHNDIPRHILHDPVLFEQLVVMRNVGKKLAGRELDGRTWDEYPAVANAAR